MSEEENLELEVEIPEEEVVEESPDDYLAEVPEEDRKFAVGWNPNNPKGKSLERFIGDGKLIAANNKIKRMSDDFESQRKSILKFHEINIKNLEEQYKDAINMSDGKAAREIMREIDDSEKQVKDLTIGVDKSVVTEWESRPENSYIHERGTEKHNFANAVFAEALSSGKSTEEALKEVEYRVEIKFGENKPMKAPKTTVSQTPTGRSQGKGVSMATLTSEEKMLYRELSGKGAWKNDAEFLKLVKEAREDEQ